MASDKTDTVSDFSGERLGQKTQKQGEVHLTDVCKIRFLMAGTQRSVSVPPPCTPPTAGSLRLGASLRLSRPLQDQTLHAVHGRAARVGNSAEGIIALATRSEENRKKTESQSGLRRQDSGN